MKAKALRSYLLAGVVVWVPILVTFALIRFIVDLLDRTVALLPADYQPQVLIGMNIPGLGVIFSLLLLLITGIIVTNIVGQRLVTWSEKALRKIPLVRTIYNATKQVMQALFATNGHAFRKVLLVEYPRKGMWSLAFQTGLVDSSITTSTNQEMISAFIPTTPNPTSGFLILVPKQDTIELAISIDAALTYIISLGVMNPSAQGNSMINGVKE